MAGLFVSYRRDDSQGFAGRLADDLAEILGDDRVFRDIEIPVGSDFADVLQRTIAASEALLVVIGPRWAASGEGGQGARLFAPADWVRTEIEAAFEQDKQVIPVLVGGAGMPAEDALPASIARLTRIQAARLGDRSWSGDIEDLADRLRALCPGLARASALPADAPSPAEALSELGRRLEREIEWRLPRLEPPPEPPGLLRRALQGLWRATRNLAGLVLAAGLVYIAMRLFGDEGLLRGLDRVEARLLIGWERFTAWWGRL